MNVRQWVTYAAVGILAIIAIEYAEAMPGPSVTIVAGDQISSVSGPAPLVALLYNPPTWVVPMIAVGAVCVLGVAYLGYRRTEVDGALVYEMTRNGLIVLLVGVFTLGLARSTSLPYVAVVVVGAFSGFFVAQWMADVLVSGLIDNGVIDVEETYKVSE